jgi:hypothetical protein
LDFRGLHNLSYTLLQENLQLPSKKINYFISFIESIIQTKTINLEEISQVINPEIKQESNYRILQRFFKEFNFIFTYFSKLLMSFIPEKKRILIIDRTQWKDINIFFLCVEYQGIGIPILWECLDKKGSTNTLERESLIQDYINIFGKENIEYLTADREFIGKTWFNWLNEQGIKFLIRIKSNFLVEKELNNKKKVKGIFRYYSPKIKILSLFGTELRIMGKRVNSKELLIVATNSDELMLEDYSTRWLIENMFSCFKKKGFNLESTKMTDNYKIEKLIAIISIAYCWCISVGKHFKTRDSRFRKDLGYQSKSTFKIGLKRIAKSILQKHIYVEEYLKYTGIFCTNTNAFK